MDDYDWTRGVLETCFAHCPEELHGLMDGLSLHYYVHPGGWKHKGSATGFTEDVWYTTMAKALYMDTLIEKHGDIMDKYDPRKRIGLIVDEWGGWYDVEPGTNPGFLYQQNTVRDALIAGITLNIFNKRSDRVKMACLAQIVNVLQAVALTEGPDMVLTPTYHVMHMYRHHQDGDLVKSSLTGVRFATLLDSRIVTSGDIHDFNTFEDKNKVTERDWNLDNSDKGLSVQLLPASVVMLRLGRDESRRHSGK